MTVSSGLLPPAEINALELGESGAAESAEHLVEGLEPGDAGNTGTNREKNQRAGTKDLKPPYP